MSPTEDLLPPPSSIRHRKSKVDSELQLQLLHTDHRKTSKHRWSSCFSYILKRCKLKSDAAYPSSTSTNSTNMTLALPCDLFETNHIKAAHGYAISEKPTYRSTYSSSLASPTPVSSPLSPPPRHIMTSRQQQHGTKSILTSHPTKATTIRTLPSYHHHQRRHPYRPHVLRLSLNMDQRYSYTSSIESTDTHHNIDDHDDPNTATAINDLELSSRRQASSSNNSNSNHRWTMDSFSQPSGLMARDDSNDGTGGSGDFILSYNHHHQIHQDKEHYDAIVAASKLQHRRPMSSFYKHDYDNNDNGLIKDQLWNTSAATPYPRAPLAL